MNKKRLTDLENAAGGSGPGPDVTVIIDWLPNDEITATYIVDGQEMTEHEFYRRWPGWEPDNITVNPTCWD